MTAPLAVTFDSSEPTVRATCTVEELFHVAATGIRSGIGKQPREAMKLLTHGVLGDVQGDREHHGGIFKAVYAFASETRKAIAEAEGLDQLADGAFGENIVTSGIDTDHVVIGTRWKIGGAEIEATVPRQPCRTFSEWMRLVGERDPQPAAQPWSRRFNEYGRCGAYFRVLTEGVVRPGDQIKVLSVPEHGVSIGEFFRGLNTQLEVASCKRLLTWARDTATPLYSSMAEAACEALSKAGEPFDFPAALVTDGRGN